jgi:hypothetical protein
MTERDMFPIINMSSMTPGTGIKSIKITRIAAAATAWF